MSRTAGILSAFIVLVLSVLALRLVDSGRGGPARDAGGALAPGASSASIPAAEDGRDQHHQAQPLEPAARPETRSARRDEGPTIAGRVAPHGGIPPGEVVHVTAEAYLGQGSTGKERGVQTRKVRARVAEDGSFVVRLPEGARQAALDVEAPRLVLHERTRAQPGQVGILLVPEVLACIAGRVVGPPTPEGAEDWKGVRISCVHASARVTGWPGLSTARLAKRAAPTVVTAQPDGTFVIPRLPPGRELELTVEHPLFPPERESVTALQGGERREVVIELTPSCTAMGRVLDEHDQPVGSARISLRRAVDSALQPTRPAGFTYWAETGPDGQFEFLNLPRKAWRLRVQARELLEGAELLLDTRDGDVRDLVARVRAGGSIEGTVLWADGSAVEHFATSVSGSTLQYPGKDGRLSIRGLEPGIRSLAVSASGLGVEGWATAQGVRVGENALRLVLTEAETHSISGLVVDLAGTPVSQAHVTARLVEPEPRFVGGWTGEDGSFVVPGLVAGAWRLRVEAADLQGHEQELVVTPSGAEPLRVVLGREGLIRGRVLDPHGMPVAGARVWSVPLDFLDLGDSDTQSGPEGNFELAAGRARMRVIAHGEGLGLSQIQPLEVAPGARIEGVELRLTEGCRLSGLVLDPAGRPVPEAQVVVLSPFRLQTQTDENGGFAMVDLPAGEFELGVLDGLSRIQGRVTVRLTPGGKAALELRLDPAGARR